MNYKCYKNIYKTSVLKKKKIKKWTRLYGLISLIRCTVLVRKYVHQIYVAGGLGHEQLL